MLVAATGAAGERLPVVEVDARLERAAGDALQAGAAEPLDDRSPSRTPARGSSARMLGSISTRSAPEVREHLHPAAGEIHIAAATVPPGLRHARHLPDAPVGVAHRTPTTSEHIAASKVPSSQGSDSATPSRRSSAPGMRAWHAAANSAGSIAVSVVLADAPGELDGERTRTAADVEDPACRRARRHRRSSSRQPAGIMAHEAVVVLDCRGELGHGATNFNMVAVCVNRRKSRHQAPTILRVQGVGVGSAATPSASRACACARDSGGRVRAGAW